MSIVPSDAPEPNLRRLDRMRVGAILSAVFLWLTSIAFALADAANPRLPDPLINAGLIAAATLTLIALGLHLAYSRQTENATAHERMLTDLVRVKALVRLVGEGVGQLAAELEQLSARLGANGEVPQGVMAKVYELGLRARDHEDE